MKRDASIVEVPMAVAPLHRTDVYVDAMPGIVIFVHGVNSEGEWYDAAEAGLVAGLNQRLGLDRAVVAGGQLQAVSYAPEHLPNGKMNRDIDGKNFIVDPGRSPVIRFRWGYKAAGKDDTWKTEEEAKLYATKIYMNEMDAWGGGPFQNGTTALSYMWGGGLDDRVFWWLYLNMFPVEGRDIYASPPRTYFAHAAHRLKELIAAIRQQQADCPVSVVCHSQGNMVSLAAAFLGRAEGAIADTYLLCNPPYSLESIGLEQVGPLRSADGKTATGQFGSVTTAARQQTFARFLDAVKARAEAGQTLELINRHLGFEQPTTGQTVYRLGAFPTSAASAQAPAAGIDRDNRGRVFLYCNPHDQVIGVSPVQGIGWRGVSDAQLASLRRYGPVDHFHQRVWAMPGGAQKTPFRVGSTDWSGVAYRYLQDNHRPDQFWVPLPPAMRFSLSSLEPDPSRGPLVWIANALSAPLVYVITHLYPFRINADPPKDWAVTISAPALPNGGITPQARRYGRTGAFDEDRDAAVDALASTKPADAAGDGSYGGAYQKTGLGDTSTEASLRYEHAARLKLAKARAEAAGRRYTDEDDREAVRRMLNENPNATDHSTILTNPAHSEGVLAWDVAVGWVDPSKIGALEMQTFRQFAHWMMVTEAIRRLPIADKFTDYWEQGFYNKHPVQFFYDLPHMKAHAPDIIDDRERSIYGAARG